MTLSKISAMLKGFRKDENAAVTVDWVAITAIIVLLGVLATFGITAALDDGASKISAAITSASNAAT